MDNITPQGYKYGIDPNTKHPFWGNGGEGTSYSFYEFETKSILDNCSTNYNNVTLADDTNTVIVPIELLNVVVNIEILLPFIYNDKVCYLVGEGTETGELSLTGVFAPEEITLSVSNVETLPAPIKGEDGTTPDITASATVDETTGTPTVEVTKTGTTENPHFEFAFTGLKGEQGEGGSSEKQVLTLTEILTGGGFKQGDVLFIDTSGYLSISQTTKWSQIAIESDGSVTNTAKSSTVFCVQRGVLGIVTSDINSYVYEIPFNCLVSHNGSYWSNAKLSIEFNPTNEVCNVTISFGGSTNIVAISSSNKVTLSVIGVFNYSDGNSSESKPLYDAIKVMRG